jgi:hypothetical protein
MPVDYSFILSDGPFQMDAYGRKWETCHATSSNTATDRTRLDVRRDPEAQDPASLAPLKEQMWLRDECAGALRCFS